MIKSSRNREKTHIGIETEVITLWGWSWRPVAAERKPTSGLKLGGVGVVPPRVDGRSREKTHIGIETLCRRAV
jgi:hypothetical protein